MPGYSPGKNSFLVRGLHRGDRKTVLDLRGAGSVRHIWSTWSVPGDNSDIPAPGRILVRVFLNGESRPAISGALDELCRAAEATGTPLVPLPAFDYKGAFNFHLPIFFTRRIRIEIEAADEVDEFYTQIDYRTESQPSSLPRLVSALRKGAVTLNYLGDQTRLRPTEVVRGGRTQESRTLEYGPNAHGDELTINGPAVLRKMVFRGSSLADLGVRIYWDDDPDASVQARDLRFASVPPASRAPHKSRCPHNRQDQG